MLIWCMVTENNWKMHVNFIARNGADVGCSSAAGSPTVTITTTLLSRYFLFTSDLKSFIILYFSSRTHSKRETYVS